ncbi:MAG TPA: hypothetical protein ENI87_01435 [bacterium]|nr:hypothetical protein [bacterium]
MAVDEALLRCGGKPTLRLYGWRPHAVSLGWFQSLSDFADLGPTTPIVRRATGGGAIHHGDELTFSLALDAALLPHDIAASYALLHDAIVRVLRALGVPCRRAPVGGPQSARPSERWCFAAPVKDDLVTDAGKLLGSAQRRITTDRPRVLHHGSLVLHRPQHTPFVAAVADHVEVDDSLRARLRRALVAELAASLERIPQPGTLTAAERTLATTLRDDVYGSQAHLDRRP